MGEGNVLAKFVIYFEFYHFILLLLKMTEDNIYSLDNISSFF